jgi:hypothetical protein
VAETRGVAANQIGEQILRGTALLNGTVQITADRPIKGETPR